MKYATLYTVGEYVIGQYIMNTRLMLCLVTFKFNTFVLNDTQKYNDFEE